MITIIDYGMGNIHSVQKALELCGAKTLVTNEPDAVEKSEKTVLPGVGAFDEAMIELEKRGLVKAIKKNIADNKPFLGICLGMQLLFNSSQEAKQTKGMSILEGTVKKFDAKNGIKVPHMGWNQIKLQKKDCPLLKDIPENSAVYFCHSYYPAPCESASVAASCGYGIDFAAIIWSKNIYGAQFHPEKSQDIGIKMLKNFVELC
jgi:glutamine amidotransferase